MTKTDPLRLRDDFHQVGLDFVRVVVFSQPEPLRHAQDMSINTDGLSAVGIAQDNIRGFSADARQRE
jgi:hypothetical protein